ncbi:uncharacterized protein LOC118451555 [Vespa mandarinia]|uniref:uncharacterized protein LOC118451555 n=1 Tax=Vespa mandarinia TaxID=7446 RepID=UPI00160CF4EB|nr:uncharacterized protein LOC118451555 [Vespa mandarinia]
MFHGANDDGDDENDDDDDVDGDEEDEKYKREVIDLEKQHEVKEHLSSIMLWIVTLFIHILLVVAKPTENDVVDYNTTDAEFLRNNCVLSTKYKYGDLKEPQPLILTRNGTASVILYPDVNGILKMQAGQSIYLACPGKQNSLRNMNYTQEITKSSCYGRNTHFEIGFNLSTDFLRMIELCHNEKTYNTYYTKFRLTKLIGGHQAGYPRPKWNDGDHYGEIDINEQYKFSEQLITLEKLLNSSKLAKSYLMKSIQFLSRGHMVAKVDFIYGALQSLTFWTINTAPQWISFNIGNWRKLEECIRNFATNRSLDLDVYTGVHGQMTLPNARGKQKDIYLYVNDRTKAVPVPKFFWKIIYDPRSKKGTAFVGLNNPFIKSKDDGDNYICSDISSTIKWLKWNAENTTMGISYACTVDDLRKAVPTIPKFKTIGVLT